MCLPSDISQKLMVVGGGDTFPNSPKSTVLASNGVGHPDGSLSLNL